jgi:hypothetical protein
MDRDKRLDACRRVEEASSLRRPQNRPFHDEARVSHPPHPPFSLRPKQREGEQVVIQNDVDGVHVAAFVPCPPWDGDDDDETLPENPAYLLVDDDGGVGEVVVEEEEEGGIHVDGDLESDICCLDREENVVVGVQNGAPYDENPFVGVLEGVPDREKVVAGVVRHVDEHEIDVDLAFLRDSPSTWRAAQS